MKEIVVNDKFIDYKTLEKGEMALVLNQETLSVLFKDENAIVMRCSLKNKKQLCVEILTGEDELCYYIFPVNEKLIDFVVREKVDIVKLFLKEPDDFDTITPTSKVRLCFSGYFQSTEF